MFDDLIKILENKKAEIEREYAERMAKVNEMLVLCGYSVENAEEVEEVKEEEKEENTGDFEAIAEGEEQVQGATYLEM